MENTVTLIPIDTHQCLRCINTPFNTWMLVTSWVMVALWWLQCYQNFEYLSGGYKTDHGLLWIQITFAMLGISDGTDHAHVHLLPYLMELIMHMYTFKLVSKISSWGQQVNLFLNATGSLSVGMRPTIYRHVVKQAQMKKNSIYSCTAGCTWGGCESHRHKHSMYQACWHLIHQPLQNMTLTKRHQKQGLVDKACACSILLFLVDLWPLPHLSNPNLLVNDPGVIVRLEEGLVSWCCSTHTGSGWYHCVGGVVERHWRHCVCFEAVQC